MAKLKVCAAEKVRDGGIDIIMDYVVEEKPVYRWCTYRLQIKEAGTALLVLSKTGTWIVTNLKSGRRSDRGERPGRLGDGA